MVISLDDWDRFSDNDFLGKVGWKGGGGMGGVVWAVWSGFGSQTMHDVRACSTPSLGPLGVECVADF